MFKEMQESLRQRVRDTLWLYYVQEENFREDDAVDRSCLMADIIFDALGISPEEQDKAEMVETTV